MQSLSFLVIVEAPELDVAYPFNNKLEPEFYTFFK